MRNRMRYWMGRWNLAGQFPTCPGCNSSPPDPSCSVCEGSYHYGPRIKPGQKEVWRERWDRIYQELT